MWFYQIHQWNLPKYTVPGLRMRNKISFDKHINAIVKTSCFYLTKGKLFLCFRDFERADDVFISSRVDYCNSLLQVSVCLCLADCSWSKNTSARLLKGTCKWDYICMACVGTFLNSDHLSLHISSISLRSVERMLLAVPRPRGDRAFAVAAPRGWNKVPFHMWTSPALAAFVLQQSSA